MEMCHLGCGQEAKYKNKQGKYVCSQYSTQCIQVRLKNSAGLKKAFKENRKRTPFNQKDLEQSRISREKNLSSVPFEKQSWERQRKTVLAEQDNKCLICGLSEWQGHKIKLQVDHIDGNWSNDARNNLRALCPNCHSNTETYCSKNINTRKKVEDSRIIEEINKGLSIRKILINVGLTPKGGNYERVNKLRYKYPS